jgi:Major Facilitator Superfamily
LQHEPTSFEPTRRLKNDVTADEATRAGRREWIGLAVLALACVLYSMDLTVLHLAVPALSGDLEPSSAQLLWIVDIYGFLLAGSLITMGTLGDRIGRRRLLLIGAAAFGVASLLAAFSTSAEMLIAARALLGVAGATLAPSTLLKPPGRRQPRRAAAGRIVDKRLFDHLETRIDLERTGVVEAREGVTHLKLPL